MLFSAQVRFINAYAKVTRVYHEIFDTMINSNISRVLVLYIIALEKVTCRIAINLKVFLSIIMMVINTSINVLEFLGF